MKSDVLTIKENDKNIEIICEDGSFFSFPKTDCKQLPITHTSAEELAEYFLNSVLEKFSMDFLINERKIKTIEVSVSEAPGQTAFCKRTFR